MKGDGVGVRTRNVGLCVLVLGRLGRIGGRG